MSDAAKPSVVVYTDGACKGNPGRGGWGVWMVSGPHEKEMWGGEMLTTNNRMELMGAIMALAALKRGATVAIANKECLVCAGAPFMAKAKEMDAALLPVKIAPAHCVALRKSEITT